MTYREPPRRRSRRLWPVAVAVAAVGSGVLLGADSWGPATVDGEPASLAAPDRPGGGANPDQRASVPSAGTVAEPPVIPPVPPSLGADGGVPDGGLPLEDDSSPAVSNLDPELLAALRRAATDAAGDAVDMVLNSGWRSAEYQEELLRDAIAQYGSEEEAARWVSTPETSAHVSGDAADIGPAAAAAWLSGRGAAYGLCQIYENEPWHYELRPDAAVAGCPAMYADPTDDPRMH